MTDICVPWRDHGDNWRRLAFEAVTRSVGDAKIIPGDSDPESPFNRSAARNNAAAAAAGDVLVFMDADVLIGTDALQDAIREARNAPGLVKPFARAGFLTKTATIRYYATGVVTSDYLSDPVDGFIGLAWVIRRDLFDRMGGFDEKFVGYGGEDNAFSSACETLLGPTRFVGGTASALWHPATRNTSEQNMSRLHRYWRISTWDDYNDIRSS